MRYDEEKSDYNIGYNYRKNVSRNAVQETFFRQNYEENYIESYRQRGVQYALHRKKFRLVAGADILRARRMEVRRQNVHDDYPIIISEALKQQKCGRNSRKHSRRCKQHKNCRGKHRFLVFARIYDESEYAFAKSCRRKRYQEVCHIRYEVGGAELFVGQTLGIKPRQQENEHF